MKISRIIFVIFFFCIYSNLKAQSVFSLDLKKDITLSTLAIGLFTSSWFIENPPDQMPKSLDRSDINAFDDFFMVPGFNQTIANAGTATMVSMVLLSPVLPVIDNFNMNTLITYGVMYSQSFLLTFGTRNLLKNNIPRFRPYTYDGRDPLSLVTYDHNSFPSGSTSMSFLAATFASTAFSMEYPDSKWKWPVIAGSYTLAGSIGVIRILSGQHFITDVFAGAAIGSFYGWIIPFLHKDRNNNITFNFTGNGMLVSARL